MNMTSRLIPFDGDDAAYIQFLEAQVFELKQALRSEAPIRVPRFSSNRDLDGDSNRQEAFRHTDNSNSITKTPEIRRNWTRSLLEARSDRRHGAEHSSSECETLKVIEYDPTHNNNQGPGDSLLNADFLGPMGDSLANVDFTDMAWDPLLNADFLDPMGDLSVTIDFNDIAKSPVDRDVLKLEDDFGINAEAYSLRGKYLQMGNIGPSRATPDVF